VLVNTSFNVRGEPIVCTPEDAYRCFRRTHMDALVLGPFLVTKSMLPDADADVLSAAEVAEVYGLD
jgi:carbamoyltransferase